MPVFMKYGEVDFPTADVNHSEFKIVKLLDAATPKLLEADSVLDYSGGDELTAGFRATGQPSADGSGDNTFPTETMKMTYGAIEWTYSTGGGDELTASFCATGHPSADSSGGLTSEPTAPEAGHVKVFSGVDMTLLTAPEPQERYTFVFDGNANTTGDGGSFDDLAVDPNNPNADLRDGEYVLTGLQHVATDTSSATGDSYAGSHALYDLFLPM